MPYKFNPFTKKFDYYESASGSVAWSSITGGPSSSPADIDDAVVKRHSQNTDTGTNSSTFQIDNDASGPKLKNNGGVLEVKDSADSAYSDVRAENVIVNDKIQDGNPLHELTLEQIYNSTAQSHDQDTDTFLDFGGPNEVTAAEIRSHIDDTNNPHGTTAEQVPTNQTGETVQDSLDSKEILANKSTATDLGGVSPSNTLYPSQAAVKAYADQLIGAANAVVYKGTIDASTNPDYPAADAGHLYVISVAGKIGGVLGVDVEVGDIIICKTDGSPSGSQLTVGANWDVIEKNDTGVVSGPTSSVDSNLASFDGITGKLIKDSGISTSDVNQVLSDTSGVNTGDQTATTVPFTPNGDIAASNVQSAIQEVRDDTDTKLAAKVTGPGSAVDSHIAEYDGTTGKLIKDGGLTHANLANTSGTNTGDETTTTLGNTINGATSKTTPVDADQLGLMDSAASNILKKLSWANVKATLKTYFDTLYALVTGTTSSTFQINSGSSGPKLKDASGVLEVRNAADSAYSNIKAQDVVVNNELSNGTDKTDIANLLDDGFNIILGNGSDVIATGIQLDYEIPFDCTITEVSLFSTTSGSIVIDIWKDTYANFPATVADTITASAKPTLSSAVKSQDSTLTGWTKTLTKGDIIRINVDSVSTVTQVTLAIKARKR